MKKVLVELDDATKKKFSTKCIAEDKTQKEVITELILKWLKRKER